MTPMSEVIIPIVGMDVDESFVEFHCTAMGLDVASVRPAPWEFFIQERFREPYYRKFRDATVTEWNTVTDLPSELHKIAAQIFVYGYYDPAKNLILGALAINVPQMIREIGEGRLPYTRDQRSSKDQDFIGVKWDDLHDAKAIMLSTLKLSRVVETLPDTAEPSRWTPEEREMWGL
jgi:hypothetical protein